MSVSEPRVRIQGCHRVVLFLLIQVSVFCHTGLPATADMFSAPTEGDIPELIRSLGDPNVQLGASRALTSLRLKSVAPLQQALEAEASEVRIWAAYTLGRIGHDSSATIPKLAETLSDATDPYERAVAAKSLGQIATAESARKSVAVQALASALSDVDDRVRLSAATALGQLGPVAQDATDMLVQSFADETVRKAAVVAVIAIGKTVVPTLISALDDDTLRLDAAHALRSLDPVAARKAHVDRASERDLNALRLAVQNEFRDERSRIEAVLQLGDIGLEGAPILIAAFSSENESVSRAAAAEFQRVGPGAIPLLAEALTVESATVRAKAADALGAIGPGAERAVPMLVLALADQDRNVQHRVVIAFQTLGRSSSDAVPSLIGVMQNPRILEQTRSLALKVLVRAASDKQRETVIAALEESSKDSNYGISSLAKYTLKTIQKAQAVSK